MPSTPPDSDWLAALGQALGPAGLWLPGVNADEAQLAPHLIDWRQRYRGQALAVARPRHTQDVVQVIRACASHGVSVVPQGGNTSLVGGSVPDDTGMQVVLSLQRMNQIRAVDEPNLSLTADAGCPLQAIQDAAEAAGLLFPLSLASQGTCTLGGNLATNAGGTQVLRYGNARSLCLGLEVVTAQGEVWSGLSGLRKDNTGYDLRDLFIGSEGTLGIITAATVMLHPRPRGQATALVACNDLDQAIALLQLARHELDASLTAFEAMGQYPLQLLQSHHPGVALALSGLLQANGQPPSWSVLIEIGSSESSTHAQERLSAVLAVALDQGLISQAVLASGLAQQRALWLMRETIPLSERAQGLMVKHDIGLPASAITAFVQASQTQILSRWPHARIVCFGHLGDGNLHYNVQPPPGNAQGEALAHFEHQVNQVVFELVDQWGGTLSAEHGIGQLRLDELARRKSPVALGMMAAIKQALDPQRIMNPSRVLR